MVLALLSLVAPALGQTPPSTAERTFLDRVEPLLRQHCYKCHSHAASRMKGGLTLDSRSGWAKGGARGPAVVPGDPGASLLVQAIRHDDPELAMPPGRPLEPSEIETISAWVKTGAADPRGATPIASKPTDWWSLRPLASPTPPVDSNQHGWVRNPIDTFILDGLRAKNLWPAPEASRRDLIRRLSFDLIGLPPSYEEMLAFEADTRPDAYERLVDRLLASVHHGERWARHWLDQVHWAETDGMEHDLIRPEAWRYRDYLIRSLNADVPYPRWIREQLAADVFYPDQPQLTPALGFLGAGPWDQSTAVTAPKTFDYLDRDDMVAQTLGTFAGATVQCARCHDHKFDPIPQADYYAVQAVFAGVGRGEVEFDADPATHARRTRWSSLTVAAAQSDRTALLGPEATRLVAAWEADRPSASSPAAWRTIEPETYLATDGSQLSRRADAVIVARGPRPAVDTYVVTALSPLRTLGAVRLEVLTDDDLPLRGPGRMDNGNLHLSEFTLRIVPSGAGAPRDVRFARASADFDQQAWTSAHAIDGNEATAWGIHPKVGESHAAVFEISPPVAVPEGARLAFVLRQRHGGGHLIGNFRLSVTAEPGAKAAILPPDVATVLAIAPAGRSEAQRLTLAKHVVGRAAAEGLAALPAPLRTYAAAPRFLPHAGYQPWAGPKAVHLLRRGDVNQPVGDPIGPGALSCVGGLPARFEGAAVASEGARRAALADWLAHPANPLVPRSLANRLWLHHFGRGLVDTPNDLGRAGALPSHPELLDWLAAELLRNGGSFKALHRLIVTSATYRQSTRHDPRAAAVDADNRLLWRMNRRRLDAESYRDALLALAGRLDQTVGGPSVRQFAIGPPRGGDTPTTDYAAYDWDAPGASRRAVYRFVFRTRPDPFLEQLDFPDASQLVPTRPFSASPLQALALLNDGFVLRQAEHLADSLERSAGDLEGRVVQAVRRAWLREPTAEERAALVDHARRHGLAALGRLLVNTNEFLFVE